MLPLLPLFALAGPGLAACTRPQLEALTSLYLNAQTHGTPSLLPLSSSPPFTYLENDQPLALLSPGNTLLTTPLTLLHTLTIHDPVLCASLIEFNAVTTSPPSTPYVVLARLSASPSPTNTTNTNTTSPPPLVLTKLDTVLTTTGDWLFNATSHLSYSLSESWAPLPASSHLRTPRAQIQAAADAYLDQWRDPKLPVPLGTPCARLEGGSYSAGKNASANTCGMPAFPEPLDVQGRRYVVDEEMGAVGVLNGFPWLEKTLAKGESTPSGNVFRVEAGLVRYVHEVTVCWTKGRPGCGR